MAPQKHLAASANTTQVFSPEHRGICTALRGEANTSAFLSRGKHPFPPNLRHKEPVSDKDADTALDRALQNACATRPCVAERHTAARSAWWSLTLAVREFAAAQTSLNRPSASAKARAKLRTRGAPEPGTSLCAKATSRIHTRGVPGPRSSSLSTPCPTLSSRLALGLCTRASSSRRNGGRHHFVPLCSIARAHAVIVLDKN
jgi:hypothetical protein